ncbi:NHLP bacteriocin export ABC transporter permease/ATPase subunit [Bradyrhizobium niftali]|jgi:NHLM bacteriocin system ABC transporter ATP-binding protein|uniref:NHLP bacteriocin export ABC transporter permease/ATPase subunit n=1 Tax=Bradyrhizobium niftali TaxID=2560055 RepID=A0A4Y9M265_9BRAD|nr:NHLP bacteriocin export ABC transporter permease/ATPase subunit [Bradyrhizobium niftali]TFV49240.1 NHLP bacteriocin export ABC transporter permease/ATPase subunit [Bradyrhizobium niftali]
MSSAYQPPSLETPPRHTAAAPIALESHRPLPIDDIDLVLDVVRGYVDLFAVRESTDGGPSRRHHMFRVEQGGVVFGLPSISDGNGNSMTVIAVGGLETKVMIGDRGHYGDRDLIDAWTGLVSGIVATPAQGAIVQQAAIGSRYTLASGGVLRLPGRQVGWIGIERGTVTVMAMPEVCGSGECPLPVPPGTWLVAGEDATLKVGESSDFALAEIWAALDRFHVRVMESLYREIEQEAFAEADRLLRRSGLNKLRTRSIVGRLAGIIAAESGPSLPAADGANALIAACREAGAAMGIALQAPASLLSGDDDLANAMIIAQASRVRSRRLLLRADWWINSVGPFVAFRGEDRRPVAVLPGAGGRHTIVDPGAGLACELTRATASELAPEAVMFYRALPAPALRVRDLLKFGAAIVRADVLRIMLAALCLGLLALATPLVIKLLIDSVLPRAEADQLLICAAALAVVTLVAGGFQIMQGIAMLRLESRLDWVLQAAIVDRLLRMPASFFRSSSVGDLADRALGIEAVRTIITGRAVRGFLALVSCLFSFSVMLYLDIRLGMLAVALAVLRVAMVVTISLARLSYERQSLHQQGRLEGLVLQFVTGVGKLRIANATTHALAIWVERFAEQKRNWVASQRAGNLQKSLEAAFPATATLLVFALAQNGHGASLPLGTFLAFYAAFGLSLAAVGEWAQAAGELLVAIPRIERLRPIIATATEIGDDRKSVGDISGTIEFARVSFRYGGNGPRILDDVSLSVGKGEYLAIVGPSGSGKSTLVRLLLGFEKPESGVVLVDGKSLETIDIGLLRRQVGVVLQNSRLASGSIYDNICGAAQLSLDRAWEIARLAGLDRDIESMPMGMQTLVAEGVSTLSGGQRQRLLIARALAHKPRLLLMDEATSALDNRTQAVVSDSISRLNLTRIVVAHRLSTVQSADRIVVLDAGKIVQTGTYAELMTQRGLFTDFAERQLI